MGETQFNAVQSKRTRSPNESELRRSHLTRNNSAYRLAQGGQRVEGRGGAAMGAGLDHGFDDLGAAEPDVQRGLGEFRRLGVEPQGGERGDRDQSALSPIEARPVPNLPVAVLDRHGVKRLGYGVVGRGVTRIAAIAVKRFEECATATVE